MPTGARCHELANLLQHYYFAAQACAGALGPKYQMDNRREELGEAEVALRRFVSECRRGRATLAVG